MLWIAITLTNIVPSVAEGRSQIAAIEVMQRPQTVVRPRLVLPIEQRDSVSTANCRTPPSISNEHETIRSVSRKVRPFFGGRDKSQPS
jgi:hypothetical protein